MPPVKVEPEQLTITVHAIANFRLRAREHSVVSAVDRLKDLYAGARFHGIQDEPKGRSPGKSLRAPRKPKTVTVWQTFDGPDQWLFYVRGSVLLTVHHHKVERSWG